MIWHSATLVHSRAVQWSKNQFQESSFLSTPKACCPQMSVPNMVVLIRNFPAWLHRWERIVRILIWGCLLEILSWSDVFLTSYLFFLSWSDVFWRYGEDGRLLPLWQEWPDRSHLERGKHHSLVVCDSLWQSVTVFGSLSNKTTHLTYFHTIYYVQQDFFAIHSH